jgi:hypothetical protein
MGPELGLAGLFPVRNHDPLQDRLFAGPHPHLEIRVVVTHQQVVTVHARQHCLAEIIGSYELGGYILIEVWRDQIRQRRLHTQFGDGKIDGCVEVAVLFRLCVDIVFGRVGPHVISVEYDGAAQPVASLGFHAEPVRPRYQDLSRGAELDLHPGVLYDVEAILRPVDKLFGGNQIVSHVLEHAQGLGIDVRVFYCFVGRVLRLDREGHRCR